MKLLGISLFCLFATLTIWVTLSQFGGAQSYQAYDHALMKLESPSYALSTSSPEAAEKFLLQNKKHGLRLPIHISSDGKLFTAPKGGFDFLKTLVEKNPAMFKGLKPHLYSFEFLKSQNPEFMTAETWKNLKPAFWIFDIQDNATDADRYIVEWVEAHQLADQLIIRSDVDLVVSSLKRSKPLWIYGSSLSDNTQFLTMASAHLEGLPRFLRDYYFTTLTYQNRDMINPRVFDEMRKRQKKIAIGPVFSLEEKNRAASYLPDILILDELLLDTHSQNSL